MIFTHIGDIPLSVRIKLISVPVDRKSSWTFVHPGSEAEAQQRDNVPLPQCLLLQVLYLLSEMCLDKALSWTFPNHFPRNSYFFSTSVLPRRGRECAIRSCPGGGSYSGMNIELTCPDTDAQAFFYFFFSVPRNTSLTESILSCVFQVHFKNKCFEKHLAVWEALSRVHVTPLLLFSFCSLLNTLCTSCPLVSLHKPSLLSTIYSFPSFNAAHPMFRTYPSASFACLFITVKL